MEIRFKNLFENKAKTIKPFNLRIPNPLNEIKINPKIMHDTILLKTTPWNVLTLHHEPIVTLKLTKFLKTKTEPITFQDKFLSIQNNFPNHHLIHTDGSKQEMKVGTAAIFQNQKLLKV